MRTNSPFSPSVFHSDPAFTANAAPGLTHEESLGQQALPGKTFPPLSRNGSAQFLARQKGVQGSAVSELGAESQHWDMDPLQCYREYRGEDGFMQLTPEKFMRERSHPTRGITDISSHDMEMFDFGATQSEMKTSLAEVPPEDHERCALIRKGQVVQVVGTSMPGQPPRHTSTNKIGRLSFTDGMGPCIGALVGGERREGGIAHPGAVFEVWHFAPKNIEPRAMFAAAIEDKVKNKLTPVIALHGGDATDPASVKLAQELLAAIDQVSEKYGIEIEPLFDETCEDRVEDTLLGGVIDENHRVVPKTMLVRAD